MNEDQISEYNLRMAIAVKRFFDSDAGQWLRMQWQYEIESMIMPRGFLARTEKTKEERWDELKGYRNAISKPDRIIQALQSEQESEKAVDLYGITGGNGK